MQPISTLQRFWPAGKVFGLGLLLSVTVWNPAVSDSSRTGISQKGTAPMPTAIATKQKTAIRPPIDEAVPSQIETATFALG
jgi:hypothetical protein